MENRSASPVFTMDGVNDYRHDRDAINIIYKSLQDDREQADITSIIREPSALSRNSPLVLG
jgi:hypothetical protein